MEDSYHSSRRLTFAKLLVVAFVLSLVLRIGLALTVREGLHWPDSKWYFLAAESIHSTGSIGSAVTRAPLYPYFLAALFSVSSRILFVRVCESVLASLLPVLLGLLGRRLFSEKVGLLAAFASAVYPYFVYLPSAQVSDNIVTVLLLASVLCLGWRKESVTVGLSIASGVFLGLCLLARPSMVMVVPGMLAWPLAWKRGRPARPLMRRVLLVFVVSLATVAPWTVRNYAVTGHLVFVATGGGRQFWYGNSPYATASTTENPEYPPELKDRLLALPDEPSRERLFYREGLKFVRENPGAAFRLYVMKLANLFQFFPSVHTTGSLADRPGVRPLMGLASFVLFALAIAGAVMVLAARDRPTLLPLVVVSYCLGSAVFLTVMRYRLPVDPYIILLAALALAKGLRWPLDTR